MHYLHHDAARETKDCMHMDTAENVAAALESKCCVDFPLFAAHQKGNMLLQEVLLDIHLVVVQQVVPAQAVTYLR